MIGVAGHALVHNDRGPDIYGNGTDGEGQVGEDERYVC